MTDREKAINGLKCCTSAKNPIPCGKCGYFFNREYEDVWSCRIALMRDSLELLKEQEPMEPTWDCGKAYCGDCGRKLPRKKADREINYCSYCGRSVKWK